MDKIIKDLKEFIEGNILSEGVEINSDSILKEIGVDSFSIVEIVLFIERKYDKLIPDDKMVPETFQTLRKLAEVIEEIKE